MKKPSMFGLTALVSGVLASVLAISCSQSPPAPPSAPPPTEIGRYQMVVTQEGERGAVMFLLDTKEGKTWIYRPPQPPLGNGIWVDIPLVTYPPDFWQRILSQMIQQSTATNVLPGVGPTSAPPPAVTNR